jgi:hypothetical protein
MIFQNVGIGWRHQLLELEVKALLYLTSIISYNQYFISVVSRPHKIWICCHYYKRKSRRRKNKNTRKLFGKKKKLLQRYYNYISITKFTPFPRSKHGQDTSSCVYINYRETTYVQIFIVLVKKFQNLSQSKYFFLMRRKAKNCFPIMWNRNTFFHKNNTLSTQIQQRNIFFSSRWRHNFFFSYNAKSNFFSVS